MATETDSAIDTRLTPARRLTQGLAHTAGGPVDITRGAVGLTVQGISGTASGLRRRYRAGKLKRNLADVHNAVRHELAAAQEAVASLPSTDGNRRRRLLIGAAATGLATLAGGAALFSVVRRSRQPEPSPLPPSVSVEPKP